MHLELDTLLDLYLLQDEFLRGGALWRGEGDEVGAGGEVTEREGGILGACWEREGQDGVAGGVEEGEGAAG